MPPEILISEARIKSRVAELGSRIAQDYAGRELLLVVLLKGAFLFAADLARAISSPLQIEFITVSSYRGQESSGEVAIVRDLGCVVAGRELLLVEDIVDTGLTLARVIAHLQERQPRSLAVCSLLSKPSRRLTEIAIPYLGFEVEDRFVVGYGLDYEQQYRQLPYLGVLAPGGV